MSQLTLKRIVGLALLDREFCNGLMNGKRSALLSGLDLTEEERVLIMSLECGSIRELAGGLCQSINSAEISILPEIDRSPVAA
jgi:hypothetical protein